MARTRPCRAVRSRRGATRPAVSHAQHHRRPRERTDAGGQDRAGCSPWNGSGPATTSSPQPGGKISLSELASRAQLPLPTAVGRLLRAPDTAGPRAQLPNRSCALGRDSSGWATPGLALGTLRAARSAGSWTAGGSPRTLAVLTADGRVRGAGAVLPTPCACSPRWAAARPPARRRRGKAILATLRRSRWSGSSRPWACPPRAWARWRSCSRTWRWFRARATPWTGGAGIGVRCFSVLVPTPPPTAISVSAPPRLSWDFGERGPAAARGRGVRSCPGSFRAG
ncbi:hypothetical protein QJS66_10715 [Kocuria rhizophila]|nr:hypothetical protein QJS66_10715 [Kocuria rhizophila]